MGQINKPKVSILMTTYNSHKDLLRSVSSVLWQNYANFELLILNDASTDETKEVLENFSDERIKKFNFKKNRGQLWRMNSGKRLASGDYIAFLDTGDIWFPEFLTNMIEATSDGTKYAYCWCSGQIRKPLLSIDNNYADFLYQGILADTITLFCDLELAKNTKFTADGRYFHDDMFTLSIAKKEKIKLVPKDLCIKLETSYDDGVPHSANFKLTAKCAIDYYDEIKNDVYEKCGFLGLSRHNYLLCLKLLQGFEIILFFKHIFLAFVFYFLKFKTRKIYNRKIHVFSIFKSLAKNFFIGINYKLSN